MISFGIMPLLIEDPILQPRPPDTVYIFQHPGGDLKHSSSGEIEEYVPPFIKYNAETRRGSSGSPVVVKVGDSLELVAIHFEGVGHPHAVSSNYNMGVVMSEIFNHIKTGNCKYCDVLSATQRTTQVFQYSESFVIRCP